MATRFNFNVEADTASELRLALADLAGMLGGEGAEGEDSNSPPAATSRGGRRRKSSDAAPDTPASGAPASEPANGQPGDAAGPTATSTASPSEPAPPAAGAPTKDMMVKAMSDALAAMNALGVQEELKKAGLPPRISEMTPEQYPAALAIFERIVAASA